MATKNAVVSYNTVTQDGSAKLVTWASLANGDDGAWLQLPEFGDRCVQVSGTFGVGGTVVFEGTNDTAIAGVTLNNAQSGPLSLTAVGVKQVVEIPLFVRPRVTAGDGTTALIVSILARRANPMRT